MRRVALVVFQKLIVNSHNIDIASGDIRESDNDALFFAIEAVSSEADLCREAQKLGALCGCPVPENACSICEGSQIRGPASQF